MQGESEYWTQFGERLREARGRLKTSWVAGKLDLDQSGYSKFENAERRMSLYLVCKFCEMLDVDVSWLVTGQRRAPQQKRAKRNKAAA